MSLFPCGHVERPMDFIWVLKKRNSTCTKTMVLAKSQSDSKLIKQTIARCAKDSQLWMSNIISHCLEELWRSRTWKTLPQTPQFVFLFLPVNFDMFLFFVIVFQTCQTNPALLALLPVWLPARAPSAWAPPAASWSCCPVRGTTSTTAAHFFTFHRLIKSINQMLFV